MPETESAKPKRISYLCPLCDSNRFTRLETGNYDQLTGKWVIGEITLRCVFGGHEFTENQLRERVVNT